MSPEARFLKLNLKLPPPPEPVATYRTAVKVGNLLFISGHGPVNGDGTYHRGKVGAELNVTEAMQSAALVGLCMLSTIRSVLGSLNKVVRVVKVLGVINSSADFADHSQVLNGFSDLMAEVFGEAGIGARSAVGTSSLPLNIPIEVEAIFEVRD